ncbi:MAG: hypothetical protein CML03_05560 [Pseudooceanicola sp.]|nr:hypothetical protein [Pseudooceanicola sp.]
MIASLPMYDWPEVQPANDRLWRAMHDSLARSGVEAPETLTRHEDLWAQWEAPDLLFSQTCSLPYQMRLKGKVTLLASPDYRLDGCPPGYYASKIVVRRADDWVAPRDWRAMRLAFNELRSQSGWASILTHAQTLGTGFASQIASGAHRTSARMVAKGKADIAAIDAQSWRMVQAYDPWATRLSVIGQTRATPATPFVTAVSASGDMRAKLCQALQATVAQLPASDRAVLHLHGVAPAEEIAYLTVPTPHSGSQWRQDSADRTAAPDMPPLQFRTN